MKITENQRLVCRTHTQYLQNTEEFTNIKQYVLEVVWSKERAN